MSVHFQFNHSKCNQDLQTIHFHLLNLHNRFSAFFFLFCWEGNIFLNQLNWKWSEISPEFRIAEATNEKKNKKNCWFSIQTAHSSICIWTDSCEISISRKLQFTKQKQKKPTEKPFVFNNIAVTEVWKNLRSSSPSALPRGNWVHRCRRTAFTEKMTGLDEKSAFVLFTR